MKEKKNVGWFVGNAFGVVLAGCLISLAITLTVKIITMIL